MTFNDVSQGTEQESETPTKGRDEGVREKVPRRPKEV